MLSKRVYQLIFLTVIKEENILKIESGADCLQCDLICLVIIALNLLNCWYSNTLLYGNKFQLNSDYHQHLIKPKHGRVVEIF